jgi:hypothetical protein
MLNLQMGILNTAPADVLRYLRSLVLNPLFCTMIPFTPVHSAVLMMAPKLRASDI